MNTVLPVEPVKPVDGEPEGRWQAAWYYLKPLLVGTRRWILLRLRQTVAFLLWMSAWIFGLTLELFRKIRTWLRQGANGLRVLLSLVGKSGGLFIAILAVESAVIEALHQVLPEWLVGENGLHWGVPLAGAIVYGLVCLSGWRIPKFVLAIGLLAAVALSVVDPNHSPVNFFVGDSSLILAAALSLSIFPLLSLFGSEQKLVKKAAASSNRSHVVGQEVD